MLPFDDLNPISQLRVRIRPLPPPPSTSLWSVPSMQDTNSSSNLPTYQEDEVTTATEDEGKEDRINGGRFSDIYGVYYGNNIDEDHDDEEEEEGCTTPRSSESQIPELHNCPPAPKKRKSELGEHGHELEKKKQKMMTITGTQARTAATRNKRKINMRRKDQQDRHVFFPDFDPSLMFNLLCT